MTPAPTPEPVRTDELPAAFRLLFQHSAASDREARVTNALRLVRRGELDPQGLFVLRGGELLGAVLCLPMPGASGLVWPPQCLPDLRRAAREDSLLRRAADWLRDRNVKVAQAFLAPEEVPFADSLPRNGFAYIASLWFLRHDLALSPRLLNTPVRLDYRPYDPSDPVLFHQTLQRTYEETLDYPELNGARGVDEAIAGHWEQGKSDPDRWQLALADGLPVGVLLLAESPDTGDWETSYVGVVPEARRRGFGRELMLRALTEARAAGAPSLTLSVDARNLPAWDLYRGLGFEPYDRREVFLAVWK